MPPSFFLLHVVDICTRLAPKLDGLSENEKKTAKSVMENLSGVVGGEQRLEGVMYTDDDPEPKFGEKRPNSCIISIRKLNFS